MFLVSSEGEEFEIEVAFGMRSPFLAAQIQRNTDHSAPLHVSIPFDSPTSKKMAEYLTTSQDYMMDDGRYGDQTDLIGLLHLIHAAQHLEINSLVKMACLYFVSMFERNAIQSIRQQLFMAEESLSSSLMTTRKWRRDSLPRKDEKLLAESKMSKPRGHLKLASGIPTRITSYSSEVAHFLITNTTRKLARINLYAQYLQGQDPNVFALGAAELESLLEDDRALGAHDIMADKILPLLIGFLDHHENRYKRRAASTLALITNWDNPSKEGVVPKVVKLITEGVYCEAALLILTNLVGDSSAFKAILDGDVLSVVERVAMNTKKHEELSACAKFLSAICRRTDDLLPQQREVALHIVKPLIESKETCSVRDSCIALAYLSMGRVQPIDESVCQVLLDIIQCLGDCDPIGAISALEVVGNIVRWGDDRQIQYMIKGDILKYLHKLLTDEYKVVQKEACEIISNITARSWMEIEDSCKRDLIYSLLKYLEKVESPNAKMDPMWAIFNCITHDIKYQEIRWPIRSSMTHDI